MKPNTIRSEIEKMSPRGSSLIEKIPFVIPHKDRVIFFRSLVAGDKEVLGEAAGYGHCMMPFPAKLQLLP